MASTKKKRNKKTEYLLPVNFPTMHLQKDPNMPFITMSLGGNVNFNEVSGTNYNPNIMQGLPQIGNFLDNQIDKQTTDERGLQTDFGAGASGFVSGAAKGAEMGSTFGPWGAAIGAATLGTLSAVQNVKGNKKKNQAAANDLANYYGGLPTMTSANTYKMQDGGKKIPSKMTPKQWYDYNLGMGNKPLPGYDPDIASRADMTYVKFYDPKTYSVQTDANSPGSTFYTKINDPNWKWGEANLAEPEIVYDPTKVADTSYSPYGSMVPKSLVIKENGGPTKKIFNPNLANNKDFIQWYKNNTPEGKNNIPYSNKNDYDYLSYYMNGDYKNYEGGHFPDTYKRTNHETFSNESIYSTPENPGGSWKGENYSKKGKFLYDNGGPLNDYNGNSHENGGIPIGNNVEVEGGETNYKDYVFSDTLTPPNKKSTFATQSKRIQSKYKDREYDEYAKRAMDQEMKALMMQNEEARLIQEAKDNHQKQIEEIQMRYGGNKKKLANGGPPYKSKGFNPFDETDASFADYTTSLPTLDLQRLDNTNREDLTDFISTDRSSIEEGNIYTPTSNKKKSKLGNEEAALALSMLPALYNNIQGFKPEVTDLKTVNPNLIDLSNERQAIKNEGAKARLIANENVRNIGGGSAAALSALSAQSSAINDNIMRALSGSYQTEATQNVGIQNTFADRNNQIINQEIIANEQNKAMSDSLKSLGLSDLSNNAQAYLKDKKLTKENKKSNQLKLDVINNLFANYKWGVNPANDQYMIQYINSFNK